MGTNPAPPELFSLTTILSLLSTVVIVLAAYVASLRLLPSRTSTKLRVLYIWLVADGLTHLTLEASFLYNCFFTHIPVASLSKSSAAVRAAAAGVPALYNMQDRLYGSAYGTNPSALLWQEYAKADKRWAGADLTIISLEILTVVVAGPVALYVAELIRRGGGSGAGGSTSGKMWFWGSALSVAELYGGFITFAPEWLSGNTNLDTSNFMYMYA